MFLEVQHLNHCSAHAIGTNSHTVCTTKGKPFVLNEGIPYCATVVMAKCMIQINLFHKILYVSWIVLQY